MSTLTEGGEGQKHSGKWKNQCKGPEMGEGLEHLKNSEEAIVA